ncbi:DUF4252 domain-containing protein [Psychroflexus sp. CAK57W]|uniref:DUF4252 domain-containing protein n=1 Tax=Psychroflexus curvus TaxID=2873595 RepID=UPI001CCF5262|nr:DUF4252 domain-containing protein [Psychroflexus curvus]MBZ9786295.1 DUF4252 domain-containing protein [Psychroflexus curvus]
MKKIILIVFAMATLVACNSKPSLQEYLVKKENSAEFISASVPTNILFQNLENLSSEEKSSLQKIDKINLLALTKKKGEPILEEEREELRSILNQPDYQSLLNFSSGDREARLLFVGSEEKIDEMIFFGYDSELGLLLLRMRGNDVNANDIYQITQSAQNLDMTSMSGSFGKLIGELGQ